MRPYKYRNTNLCESLFPGYFISRIGKVSTVHAQCCVVVVVVIVVLIDITIDVYNYRPLKRVSGKKKKHIKTITKKNPNAIPNFNSSLYSRLNCLCC